VKLNESSSKLTKLGEFDINSLEKIGNPLDVISKAADLKNSPLVYSP
jgi:hypothetical protein